MNKPTGVGKTPTVAVINHGCKLNQFEGESIAYSLERAGFEVIGMEAGGTPSGGHGDNEGDGRLRGRAVHNSCRKPDIIIINSCTVTGKSDRKSRHSVLHAARRLAEDGILVVTGCYAETDPDDLQKIERVDLVIGQRNKASIPGILRNKYGKSSPVKSDVSVFDFHDPEPNRSRAFVKVQDGCDMRCSYCKVPFARGTSQSRSDRDVFAAVRELVANGYHEVVLTGVNLGAYNYGGARLHTLISRIFEKVQGDYRIRLSSIEPVLFTDMLVDLIAQNPNIVPHFHIPLQSGSDRLLRLMKRPYTSDVYLDTVYRLRSARPESHIAMDVMVGFPTETIDDFKATERVIKKSECASLHVFRYSPRKETTAAALQDDVSYQEKSERSRRLMELGSTLNYIYRKRFLGAARDTIVQQHGNKYEGITDNYIRVQLAPTRGMQKKRCSVRIVGVEKKKTTGEIVTIY